MPPEDPIFGDPTGTPETDPSTDAPEGTPTSGAPAADPAQLQQSLTQLQEQNSALTSALREATDQLRSTNFQPAPTPSTPAPPAPLEPDDLITQFARDPEGLIREIARRENQGQLNSQLLPLIQPLLHATYLSNISTERARIDAEFGTGAFDEIILPKLEPDTAQLGQTNQAALASRETINALVDRHVGRERRALNERESQTAEARKKAEDEQLAKVVANLPPGLSRMPIRPDAQLDEEAKTFLKEVERATGTLPDPKHFQKMRSMGNTLDDYLSAVQPKAN